MRDYKYNDFFTKNDSTFIIMKFIENYKDWISINNFEKFISGKNNWIEIYTEEYWIDWTSDIIWTVTYSLLDNKFFNFIISNENLFLEILKWRWIDITSDNYWLHKDIKKLQKALIKLESDILLLNDSKNKTDFLQKRNLKLFLKKILILWGSFPLLYLYIDIFSILILFPYTYYIATKLKKTDFPEIEEAKKFELIIDYIREPRGIFEMFNWLPVTTLPKIVTNEILKKLNYILA